ncbi:hypothetical protein GCM10028807_42490 [Spirosoma daeguense]
MKTLSKTALALVLGIWLTSCQYDGKPSETVLKAFEHKFGKVEQIKWSHNVDYTYAHFKQHGIPVVAVFGNDGQYVATDDAKPIQ